MNLTHFSIVAIVLVLLGVVVQLPLSDCRLRRSPEPAPIRLGRSEAKLETHSEVQQDLARDIDRLLQEIEQEELKKGAALNRVDYNIFKSRMEDLSWYQEYTRLVKDPSIFTPDKFSPILQMKYNQLQDKLTEMLSGPQNGYGK